MFLALRRITVLASTIAVTAILSAQNTTSALLSLSSSSSTPGQTITLDLSINSPSSSFQPPATLLWKLTFPPNSVDSIGAISSIPGKVSTCATDVNAGTATCILNGPNRDVIQNGSIAQMRIAVSGRAAGSFNLGMIAAQGASPGAETIPVAGTGGTVTVTAGVTLAPSVTSLVCSPDLIAPGKQSLCTGTISTPVSTDTAISIRSSSVLLGVPAAVVVPAGATSVAFSVTAGMTDTFQSVTVSAVLNATVQRAGVTIGPTNPVPVISSLLPGSTTAGGGDFLLTVNGSNFVSSSVVLWNNSLRPTIFLGPNQLTASIAAADIAAAGVALVSVSTPAPGGGMTGGLSFTISSIAPLISQIQNAATFMAGPMAPGSIVAISGSNLAENEMQTDLTPLPTVLANVSVSVNHLAIPLKGVNPNQVNAQLPWELLPAGATTGTAEVVLTNSAGQSTPIKIQLASAAPGIFCALTDSSGVRRPTAVNGSDGSLPLPRTITYPGSTSRPATINDPAGLIVFATGLGPVANRPPDGAPGSDIPPYSTTVASPVVLIGGVPAQILFSGLSPQYPGIYQLNVILSPGTPTGDAVPIQISLDGITTTDQLKIAVSN